MSIILAEWDPQKIVNLPNEQPGEVITGERWQQLWKLIIEQGDYNSETINLLLQHYFNYIAETAAELADKRSLSTPLVHNDPLDIAGRDAVDCHPISAITGLQTILDNISAGAVGAFSHNDIGNRDAVDAHPIAAITGLEAALDNLTQGLSTLGTDHIHYGPASNLTAKLAAMDATIQVLSGGIAELAHNDMPSRNVADCHPISAITNLQTTLNGKQKTITTGTTDPAGGVSGDIYIKYA